MFYLINEAGAKPPWNKGKLRSEKAPKTERDLDDSSPTAHGR